MRRNVPYSDTPASGWLPWSLLAPVLCLAFAIATDVPASLWLERQGLIDEAGEPVSAYGLMGLLLVSFLAWLALVLGWVRVVERRSLATIGLSGLGLSPMLRGVLIGVATILGVVGMIWIAGGYRMAQAFPALADGGSLVAIALLLPCFVIQAGTEEIVFRGWLLSTVARRRSVLAGILISTALFALMHYSRGQPALVTVNVALFGLFACAWTLTTNSIWGAMGWHAGWNWLLAIGFELPVTGIDAGVPALLASLIPSSGDLLTGGERGPEGSLLCTLFFAIGILFLLRRRVHRRDGVPPRLQAGADSPTV